jgi:hypothetical protein
MNDKPTEAEIEQANEIETKEQAYESHLEREGLMRWTDERITAAKREINALVFEWAIETLTLRQAEEVACEMLAALMRERA